MVNKKLLSLCFYKHISWKNHFDLLVLTLTGFFMHSAQYPILNIFKSIYFIHSYSLIKYGIIFVENSYNSHHIFILQKKIFRIVIGENLEFPVELYLRNNKFYLLHANTHFD